ncbi:MAG: penicillin-binding transpeptidase domain-containing protein [Acidimicrobiales bacterium]
MDENEDVYADWSALRTVVPAVVGLIVLIGAGFLAYRAFMPDAELASEPAEVVEPGDDGQGELPIQQDPTLAAEAALAEFVTGLEQGSFTGMTFAFADAATAEEQFTAIGAELEPYTITVFPDPVLLVDSANATAPVTLQWQLEDGTEFDTVGEVDLVLVGTDWQVDWEASVVENSLDPGDILIRERVLPDRAAILGRNDNPLVDNRPVFNIGVIPRQVDDLTAFSESLGFLIGEDPQEIREKVAPAPSDSTVPIAMRRPEELADVQSQLVGLPGIVLEPSTFPLAPNDRFARALLGRSAEVTREILDESPELYLPGDIAGRSGLQRIYDTRLNGVPGFQIKVQRRFPTPDSPATTTSTTTGPSTTVADGAGTETTLDAAAIAAASRDIVFISPPTPGTPLNLTIDQRAQNAAENALRATNLVSSLVAVEVSTGQILAVANGPGQAFENLAMTGQYPPGSIFKTITAYGAMEKGFGPNDPVDCPLTLNVDGREFTNAEGEVLGTVPLRQAYVLSCNTAFINLASVLDPSDFPAMAARFGVGAGYTLGTASFSGRVPTPNSAVEKAATSFGQSQILLSPLSAAVMAATAAGGTYRPPILVVDPDVAPGAEQPLNPGVAASLQEMMRAVVTNGTGRAVGGVAGGPVSGKTGTAEFGNETPPKSHAWFVGFQGDVAFAVFVEGGEFGGATAAPIAADFLNRLAG